MMKNISFSLICFTLICFSTVKAQDIEQVSKEKAWSWSGSVGGNTNLYHVSGIPGRSNPFFWNLHAQFTGKIYGFELPFFFSYGQHNFSFNRPFLQAGISPSYKWIKLHLGTRNMFFSPYTLAGHTFNGVGVELTPGKWRMAAMAGNFRRARTLQQDLDPRFYNYLYKRSGYAFKLGYGGASSYIDFSYLYGKDHPNSIDFVPPVQGIQPAENHVAGVSAALKITNSLSLFGEGAVSLFTRNTNSISSEDFPTTKLARLFNVKISSRLNYAYKGGLEFKLKKFRLRGAYERIMPEFETMGSFFFVNDRENITISPSFTIFKNRLNVSTNLGIQRNNLLDNRSETTSRLIGSANVSYYHPKGWGININYTNFSTEQAQAAIALSDSVRLAIVTTNMSVTPTYSWSNETRVNSIVLSANYQQVNDRNPFTREFTNMSTQFVTTNYNLQMIESGFGITTGLNYNVIDLAMFSTTRYGVTLGGNKASKDNKFNAGVTINYNLSLINQKSDGATYTINGNVAFVPKERHSLSFFINVLRNESKQFDNYTEILSGLSYVYRLK